jgi:hypothetical protein
MRSRKPTALNPPRCCCPCSAHCPPAPFPTVLAQLALYQRHRLGRVALRTRQLRLDLELDLLLDLLRIRAAARPCHHIAQRRAPVRLDDALEAGIQRVRDQLDAPSPVLPA